MKMLNDGTVIERSDAALGVRFFLHPLQDEEKSRLEGRPIYKEIEMIEVLTPGSRDVLHRKVNQEDMIRFKAHYDAFKASSEHRLDGTPLNEFPFITAAERKELEYFNIFTGEQLVNMPDGNIDRMGVNGRDLIKKVNAYMQVAKDSAFISSITQENENLKREMEMLKKQMDQILMMNKEKSSDGNEHKANKRKAA